MMYTLYALEHFFGKNENAPKLGESDRLGDLAPIAYKHARTTDWGNFRYVVVVRNGGRVSAMWMFGCFSDSIATMDFEPFSAQDNHTFDHLFA